MKESGGEVYNSGTEVSFVWKFGRFSVINGRLRVKMFWK